MLRVLLVLLAIAVTIYGIIDVAGTPAAETRTLPKWLWLLLSLLPVLGVAAWFLFGRPVPTGGVLGVRRRARGPLAPEDDPAFLRQLDQDAWARRMEERRRSGAGDPPHGSPSGSGRPPAGQRPTTSAPSSAASSTSSEDGAAAERDAPKAESDVEPAEPGDEADSPTA